MNDLILLVNETWVRNAGNLSSNIQDKFLIPAIREAQTIDLQEIIGESLFNRLIELIDTEDIYKEEYSIYKKLLDTRINYFLLYSVMSRLCMISNFHLDNIGVSQHYDENVSTLQFKDVVSLSDYYVNLKDTYCRRLQNFLLMHRKQLKELDENTCNMIHSQLYSSASTSLWLGGLRGKRLDNTCNDKGGSKCRC